MPSAVLAIETSTSQGSVAVVREGEVVCSETFLSERSHNSQLFVPLRKALKAAGEDLAAIGLDGEHRARLDCLAIDADGAGSANGCLASDVRSGEPHHFTQIVDEQQAWLYIMSVFRAVDGNSDGFLHRKSSSSELPLSYRIPE